MFRAQPLVGGVEECLAAKLNRARRGDEQAAT